MDANTLLVSSKLNINTDPRPNPSEQLAIADSCIKNRAENPCVSRTSKHPNRLLPTAIPSTAILLTSSLPAAPPPVLIYPRRSNSTDDHQSCCQCSRSLRQMSSTSKALDSFLLFRQPDPVGPDKRRTKLKPRHYSASLGSFDVFRHKGWWRCTGDARRENLNPEDLPHHRRCYCHSWARRCCTLCTVHREGSLPKDVTATSFAAAGTAKGEILLGCGRGRAASPHYVSGQRFWDGNVTLKHGSSCSEPNWQSIVVEGPDGSVMACSQQCLAGSAGSAQRQSFSSGHVAETLDGQSAKNQEPRENRSASLAQGDAPELLCPCNGRRLLVFCVADVMSSMPGQGIATEAPLEKKY
ncbi:hypothetical protein Taro_029668 [Colocasia esculenta]|uniref:Uncharacterized protein n=1 Tax=Colocasia esculenta TaxID=4460 RepID=A0A843VVJ5_COLES|nr:hypothetical protein [Colocasia esculenta]